MMEGYPLDAIHTNLRSKTRVSTHQSERDLGIMAITVNPVAQLFIILTKFWAQPDFLLIIFIVNILHFETAF